MICRDAPARPCCYPGLPLAVERVSGNGRCNQKAFYRWQSGAHPLTHNHADAVVDLAMRALAP